MKRIDGPVTIPLRTARGLNGGESHWKRHKRVKHEKGVVWDELQIIKRPALPCSVLLTRISPSGVGLDDDNLVGSLKAVRDAVAIWIRVDDRDRNTVRFRYAQERGPWGVRVEFGPPLVGGIIDIGDRT